MLDTIEKLVTIIGLPVAIWAIWASMRSTQKTSDVEIIAMLSIRFQEKWEQSWEKLFDYGQVISKNSFPDLLRTLYDALNWIDWLGVLIEERAFSQPNLIIKSIRPVLKKIIWMGHVVLNEEGPEEWSGVFHVAKWVDMYDDEKKSIRDTMTKPSDEKP